MKKVLLVAILIIFSLHMAGCSMTREIEHLEFVNSIGIDYKDDKVNIYLQIISFTNIAKQPAASREPEIIAVGKGVGHSIEEAIVDLYDSTQQRVAWSQTKSIVFSKAALKNTNLLKEWMDIMDRYYEFRYTVWTFGTDISMDELLNTKQILNISSLYSRLTDPMDIYSQNSFIKPIYMYEFRREWHEPGNTILLPVISVRSDNWSENQKKHAMFEVTGIFPIKDQKYSTFLPKEKLFGLRWMNEDTVRTPLFLSKHNNMMLRYPKVKIIPSKRNNDTQFTLQIKMKGYLTIQTNALSKEDMEKQAEKKIRDQVLNTYIFGLENNVDIFKLSHTLYRKDHKKWRHFAENNYLPLKKDTLKGIKVTVVLKNSNLAKSKSYLKSLNENQKR